MSFASAGKAMIRDLAYIDLAIKRELFTRILVGTPVDTGQARGGWNISIGAPASGLTGRLDPDCQQGITDIQNMSEANVGQTTWFNNSLHYIVDLEYGKSRQAPAGMVRVNMAAFDQIVQAAARSVP